MKRFFGVSLTFFVVAGFVLLVIGCGGAPKDSTGSNLGTLTKDKQFEELDQLVDMDFDSEDALFGIGDIVFEQASSPYWDGVDSADVFVEAVLSSPRLSSLGKITELQAESLTLTYDEQSGWWLVEYSALDDFFGIAVVVRDSIRFETLDGIAQRDPDASTYRVIESGYANLAWDLSGDSGSFNLLFVTDAHQDVTGLNTSVVTVDGGVSGVLNLEVENISQGQSAEMDFSFNGQNNNVTVASPELGVDPCPTGGTASVDFGISIDLQEGNEHQSASGTWDVDVQFLGGGQATVNVVSGDFTHTSTGEICP